MPAAGKLILLQISQCNQLYRLIINGGFNTMRPRPGKVQTRQKFAELGVNCRFAIDCNPQVIQCLQPFLRGPRLPIGTQFLIGYRKTPIPPDTRNFS